MRDFRSRLKKLEDLSVSSDPKTKLISPADDEQIDLYLEGSLPIPSCKIQWDLSALSKSKLIQLTELSRRS